MRKDDAFYEERNVKFLLKTSVIAVNHKSREVSLSNGETVVYSKLIIATGGNVRKLQVPGSDLKVRVKRKSEKYKHVQFPEYLLPS